MDNTLRDIYNERVRQDLRWGEPVKRNLPLTLWQTVLSEEVGEVARAILHGPIDGKEALRSELIQVAAVTLAMIEALPTAPWGFDEEKAG